jgi:MOSC domain-containing protein YiiM
MLDSKFVVGTVLKLFVSQKEIPYRVEKKIVSIDQNGVIGDKFYAKEPQRSVLIASTKSYKLAEDNGIDTKEGMLGENILIDYNPYDLPVGTKIEIGEVVLEISQHCTLCKSLTKVDNSLPKLLKNDRGIFAKVIKGGNISQKDKIKIKGV